LKEHLTGFYPLARKTDLIVMGSHGVSGIEEALIQHRKSSPTIRSSSLVIKRQTELKGANFVFASDFSKEIKNHSKKN
jgi:hypothetical protein